MYNLSRDYKKLFDLICEGKVAAAFVDYRFREAEGYVHRDVCLVKRHGPFQINISARGISYGDIYPFMEKDGTEEEVFKRSCGWVNLEWIDPDLSPQENNMNDEKIDRPRFMVTQEVYDAASAEEREQFNYVVDKEGPIELPANFNMPQGIENNE